MATTPRDQLGLRDLLTPEELQVLKTPPAHPLLDPLLFNPLGLGRSPLLPAPNLLLDSLNQYYANLLLASYGILGPNSPVSTGSILSGLPPLSQLSLLGLLPKPEEQSVRPDLPLSRLHSIAPPSNVTEPPRDESSQLSSPSKFSEFPQSSQSAQLWQPFKSLHSGEDGNTDVTRLFHSDISEMKSVTKFPRPGVKDTSHIESASKASATSVKRRYHSDTSRLESSAKFPRLSWLLDEVVNELPLASSSLNLNIRTDSRDNHTTTRHSPKLLKHSVGSDVPKVEDVELTQESKPESTVLPRTAADAASSEPTTVSPQGRSHRQKVCPTCKKVYVNPMAFKAHRLLHSGNIEKSHPYPCEVCQRRFYNMYDKNKHQAKCEEKQARTGYVVTQFSCHFCKRSVASQSALQKHVKKCPFNIAVKTEDNQQHAADSDENVSTSAKHLQTKPQPTKPSGPRQKQCTECGKVYRNPVAFRAHVLSHSGQMEEARPFACSVCPRRFYNSYDLRKHSGLHADVKGEKLGSAKEKQERKVPVVDKETGGSSSPIPTDSKPNLPAHSSSVPDPNTGNSSILPQGSSTARREEESRHIAASALSLLAFSGDIRSGPVEHSNSVRNTLSLNKEYPQEDSSSDPPDQMCPSTSTADTPFPVALSPACSDISESSSGSQSLPEATHKNSDLDPVVLVRDNSKQYHKKCPLCQKVYVKHSSFRAHVYAHFGLLEEARPHMCRVCNRRFYCPGDLRRHVSRHQQARYRARAPSHPPRAPSAPPPHAQLEDSVIEQRGA